MMPPATVMPAVAPGGHSTLSIGPIAGSHVDVPGAVDEQTFGAQGVG
jgi:hypothetical protein